MSRWNGVSMSTVARTKVAHYRTLGLREDYEYSES
jgi:hypothetical protein